MTETVVVVHGLWMSGAEMVLLRHRLRRCGYRVCQFRYRTVRHDLAGDALQLQQFLATVPGETVHFVAHSLGGLVVRQLFHDFPAQRPGRIVTLGSPHNGSDTARHLARHRGWRLALGLALPPLSGELPPWQGPRPLGSIAGTLSLGIAWFIKALPVPNDGTVAECETRLAGMADHLTVRTSHAGLLLSACVARQSCRFLATGRFDHQG